MAEARAAMSAGPVPQQPPSQIGPKDVHDAIVSGSKDPEGSAIQ